MSAVGVVCIAFAKTGLALVPTVFSKLIAPGGDQQIKMLEDDLPHFGDGMLLVLTYAASRPKYSGVRINRPQNLVCVPIRDQSPHGEHGGP